MGLHVEMPSELPAFPEPQFQVQIGNRRILFDLQREVVDQHFGCRDGTRLLPADGDFLDPPIRDSVPSSDELHNLGIAGGENHDSVIFETLVQLHVSDGILGNLKACEEEAFFSLA